MTIRTIYVQSGGGFDHVTLGNSEPSPPKASEVTVRIRASSLMCAWEQFCRFAREPERRKVAIDARVTIEGTAYEVEPDLAGETVLWIWCCVR